MFIIYSFIGIDEGLQQIFRADTSGKIQWTVALEAYPLARSLQNIGNQQILVGYDRGYFIINTETGRIVHSCDSWEDVTSAERIPDGHTLVTGLNIGGSKGIWVLSLDEEDVIVESVRRTGSYVRIMQTASSGNGDLTYLLSMNTRILEADTSLQKVGEYRVPGLKHAWMAHRLESGETLVSAGYGAFMVLFDSKGRMIRKFGAEGDVPKEVNPFFYASFGYADDGNILVANWQGHGPDRGESGRQLLCFSPEGRYLESWSFQGISSFQGLLLI